MYKEKIEEYIDSHRQEMLEDICRLCRINSERSKPCKDAPFGKGVRQVLEEALFLAKDYGFATQNYDQYVGTVDLNSGKHQLDILAHLDVVSAGEGWSVTEPFKPIKKGGKLYGRGTADDKGPAIAALYAMRAVRELNIPVTKNARLILGTDEECGSSDIAYYYQVEKEAPMTFSPDSAFPVTNIEKGRLHGHMKASFVPSEKTARILSVQAGRTVNIVPGKAQASCVGVEESLVQNTAVNVTKLTGVSFKITKPDDVITITAIGKGAHGSAPGEGKNALTALLLLLSKLPFAECEQFRLLQGLVSCFPWDDTQGKALGIAMRDEKSGALTLAFSMLTLTESAMNGFFDLRYPICGSEETVQKPIENKLGEFGISLVEPKLVKPHYVAENSEFIQTLLRVYEQYTGKKGTCVYSGGGTYVHDLANGVAFGASMPGTDNRMHGADEYAVIEDLLCSAKIFAQVIADLCR